MPPFFPTRFLPICWLAACCLLFSACGNAQSDPQKVAANTPVAQIDYEPFEYTTFHPDSLVRYPVPGSYGAGFIFSPLHKNAVWLMDGPKSLEIDLQLSSQTSLLRLLGKGVSDNPQVPVWADPFQSGSFWYATQDPNNPQLIHYDEGGVQTTVIAEPKHFTTAILFEKEQVWIGGTFGLLRYDRASRKTLPVANLPNTLYRSVLPLAGGSGDLLLNHNLRFHPSTGQWEAWSFTNDCTYLDGRFFDGLHLITNFHVAIAYDEPNGIIRPLPWGSKYSGREICAADGVLWTMDNDGDSLGLKWFDFAHSSSGSFKYPTLQGNHFANLTYCTNGRLLLTAFPTGFSLYDRADHSFRFTALKVPGAVRQMRMDSRNLYLLTEQQFLVISLDWLSSGDRPITAGWDYDEGLESGKNRYMQERDPVAKDALYQSLLRTFGASLNPFFTHDLERMKENFLVGIDLKDEKNRLWVEKQVASGKIDSLQLANIYGGYTRDLARELNIEKALFYAHKSFAYSGGKQENLLKKLIAFKHEQDSIQALHLPEDAYAYAYARILENYCSGNDAFELKNQYDLSLATDRYKALVKKYPNSSWADDAAFELMILDLFDGCEGACASQESLNRLDGFVKKYPGSERIPDTWLTVARMCIDWLNEEDGTPNLQYIRLGYSYITKIKQRYPEFAQTNADYQTLASQYQSTADLYWKLEVRLTKASYRAGEPIPVTLTVRNVNDSTQTFTAGLNEGLPLIYILVSHEYTDNCEPQRENPAFRQTGTYKQDPKIRAKFENIPARGHKTWTFDLHATPQAGVMGFGNFGVYDLSRPGNYHLYVELGQSRYRITSREVSFTIE